MPISKLQPMRPALDECIDAINDGLEIIDGTVTTVKLADGAVTYAKLSDSVRKGYVRAYNNVADMQASTSLTSGMICHTNGFHTSGDGGAAYYIISESSTANGMDVLALQGGLYATLIVTNPYVTPEQFGAYGDGTHDDTTALQAAVSKANVKLTKTYLVSTTSNVNCITVPSNRSIEFDGATVTLAPNALGTYTIFNLSNVSNVRFFGVGSIVGDKDTHTGATGEWGHCININNSKHVSIDGITITKAWGDGIYIGTNNVALCEYISVTNCDVSDNSRNNISVIGLNHGRFDNLTLNDANRTAPKFGIDFEPNNNNIDAVRDVIMSNCSMSGNDYGFCLVLRYGAGNNKIIIDNCTSYDPLTFRLSTPNTDAKVSCLTLIDDSEATSPNMILATCVPTSTLEIKGAVHGSSVGTTLFVATSEINNTIINLDVYGTGIYRAGAVSGTLATRSNVVGYFRYHVPQADADGGQTTELFDKYSGVFDTARDISAITTAPSIGCDYDIKDDSTNGIIFRADRTQKGTRFRIKNSSNVTQPIRVTPTDALVAGHIGIYEATSFGVINKILDIATS